MLDGIFIGATKGRILRNAALVSLICYLVTDFALRGLGDRGVWLALLSGYVYRACTLGLYLPSLLREFIHPGLIEDPRVSRRSFTAMAAAFTGALTTGFAREAVDSRDVAVQTPDGTCDAVLIEPRKSGSFPVVLVWPDIMGLRPAFRSIGARLASLGHVVLVPNPFYRSARAPVIGDSFDFNDQDQRAKLFALRKAMTDDGIDRDAIAYLAYLDAQPKADRSRAAGVQGYCMGGQPGLQDRSLQGRSYPGRREFSRWQQPCDERA